MYENMLLMVTKDLETVRIFQNFFPEKSTSCYNKL